MTEANAMMKIKEYDDAVYYRVACGCAGGDHDMAIWAEKVGDDDDYYEIRMSVDMVAHGYRSRFTSRWLRWLDEPVNRMALALRVLFTGRVELNQEFVLGKENVRGLRVALQDIEEKFQ
jgi:hypothetical protein